MAPLQIPRRIDQHVDRWKGRQKIIHIARQTFCALCGCEGMKLRYRKVGVCQPGDAQMVPFGTVMLCQFKPIPEEPPRMRAFFLTV